MITWIAISFTRVLDLVTINRKLNSEKYCEVFVKCMLTFGADECLHNWTFQQIYALVIMVIIRNAFYLIVTLEFYHALSHPDPKN